MDTNTGTCVDMVGMSITECLYLLGNAESRACGSPPSSQVQITLARPSQVPRNVHDLTDEISKAGGPPSPDEGGNSIAPDTRDPMGYFNFISEDRPAFDQWSAFEEEPFIPSWDESEFESDHHQSITVVLIAPEELPTAPNHLNVPSTGGKTQRPASKSPETKLPPSGVFGQNGGLKKAPSPFLLHEIEHKDISMAMTGLERQVTARHEHLHHDQPKQKDTEQDPVQSPEAAPAPDSVQLPEPPTGHSDIDSSSATQGQSQPSGNTSVEPPSDRSADAPREDDPNRAEHAFDPSTSSGSLVASDNASDSPSTSRPLQRNSTRRRKGIPTEEEKSAPGYLLRKHPCPYPGCGARFDRSDNRDRHVKSIHEGHIDWTCPVRGCAKQCKRVDNGMQHLQMEHDSTCDVCGANFDNGKGLYHHLVNAAGPCS